MVRHKQAGKGVPNKYFFDGCLLHQRRWNILLLPVTNFWFVFIYDV